MTEDWSDNKAWREKAKREEGEYAGQSKNSSGTDSEEDNPVV